MNSLLPPAAPAASDRVAWCDVCVADQIFVEPDLAADELELAAPGWACSACGAGSWLDAVVIVSRRAA